VRINRPHAADKMRQLLNEVCVDLGFCLPPAELTRLMAERPPTADELTDAIFTAEGLDPAVADRALWKKVRERVVKYFNDGPRF
jgi:hypothetical protein